MICGNDVSKWQGDIDFEIYKNNTNFIIIKATEGNGYIDGKFSQNQSESRRLNIPIGYYHFARPDLGNLATSEANWFLKTIGELKEGEVLILDYEPASNPFNVVEWCKSFLDRCLLVTGCKPMIYLNQSQVRNFDWTPIVNADYALWLACYDGTIEGGYVGEFGKMAMKQWTSSQQVPGISGNVDGNYFFGTVEQFKAYGFHLPYSPSSSVSPSDSSSDSSSPSPSESPSVSPSVSASPSSSSSPSPSPEIPEINITCEDRLAVIKEIVDSNWSWAGKNGWKRKRNQIKKVLIA